VKKTDAPPLVPVGAARRLLLETQGLLADPRRKATPESVYSLIERLGFVQIDSINVVERAHHLILAARLDGYRPRHLERLLHRERRLFEHWTHDAAAIPLPWYPYWRHRFERARLRILDHPWWQERMGAEAEQIAAAVRGRLDREGPLRARDFEEERPTKGGGWWGWKTQKAALEHLWLTGTVAIAGRDGFHKVYDLAERVHPAAVAAPAPSAEEHVDWACRTALERLVIASAEELAAFWDALSVAEAKEWCRRAAAGGAIVPVRVATADGSTPRGAWALPDWRERAEGAPPPPKRIRLLAPFDPLLRDRRRALRLFGFDYRFEAFVPEPQRRYGYYVMPLLEGERLIGRLDPKLHREEGRLEVRGLWWEEGVAETKGRMAALEAALDRLCRFLGVERWTLPKRKPLRSARRT
jgi:uncharacterized protein YcaQ